MLEANNPLRPSNFNDFIGQTNIIEQLKIYIFSAKKRNCCLDHILLYGPPGLGKTSLAYIIAHELEVNIKIISAPSLENVSDLVSLITSLQGGDILFIDEIHRLDKNLEETLYSVLEDFKLNITFKSNDETKIINLDVPPFTLIGATTQIGLISTPLRDRFSINFKFNYYTNEELAKIIQNNAIKFGFKINKKECIEIASRSRMTPRVSNNLLKRILDYSIYKKIKNIDCNVLFECFSLLMIDSDGLTQEDRNILFVMYKFYKNIPVSLETISNYVGIDANSIKEVNENFLILKGYIERTKRGRILTLKGIKKCENYIKNDQKILKEIS